MSRMEQEHRDSLMAQQLQEQENDRLRQGSRGGTSAPPGNAYPGAAAFGGGGNMSAMQKREMEMSDEELARMLQKQEQMGFGAPEPGQEHFKVAGVRIPETQTRDGVIFFGVDVTAQQAGKTWRVWKRYTMFEELKQKCEVYGIHGTFPPKTWLPSRAASAATVEQRKRQLQAWLHEMIEKAKTSRGSDLQPLINTFLDVRDHI